MGGFFVVAVMCLSDLGTWRREVAMNVYNRLALQSATPVLECFGAAW